MGCWVRMNSPLLVVVFPVMRMQLRYIMMSKGYDLLPNRDVWKFGLCFIFRCLVLGFHPFAVRPVRADLYHWCKKVITKLLSWAGNKAHFNPIMEIGALHYRSQAVLDSVENLLVHAVFIFTPKLFFWKLLPLVRWWQRFKRRSFSWRHYHMFSP